MIKKIKFVSGLMLLASVFMIFIIWKNVFLFAEKMTENGHEALALISYPFGVIVSLAILFAWSGFYTATVQKDMDQNF